VRGGEHLLLALLQQLLLLCQVLQLLLYRLQLHGAGVYGGFSSLDGADHCRSLAPDMTPFLPVGGLCCWMVLLPSRLQLLGPQEELIRLCLCRQLLH
jgi:hypothetical protein